MSKETKIQWTDVTWNIARGCSKVDADCKYCYMFRDSFDGTRYNPREVVRTKTVFNLPLKVKEPSKIFTCSLTDFFHYKIDEYRQEAWDIIRRCPQHTFQILTKRPQRIEENLPDFWSEIQGRVWLGTSVGSRHGMHRVRELADIPVNCIKFLSIEPLHEDLKLFVGLYRGMGSMDWIIVGGESGHESGLYRYRPCNIEWIEDIVEFGQAMQIPVFVKQLGTHLSKQLKMSDRHGGNIDEFPEHLRIREFPKVQ